MMFQILLTAYVMMVSFGIQLKVSVIETAQLWTILNIFLTFSSLTLISVSAILPNMNGMIGTMVLLGVFLTVLLPPTQYVPNNVLLNVPSVLLMVVLNVLPDMYSIVQMVSLATAFNV
jgi:hypothetical protein